jgi:hypothetical protein
MHEPLNIVQHLRDFGGFEMNKRDLGRQREDGILAQKKKFFTKLKTSHDERRDTGARARARRSGRPKLERSAFLGTWC